MIRPITRSDAEQVASIYNHYVTHSVATFELEPVSIQTIQQQIATTEPKYPWLVLEIGGDIVGYAKLSQWKVRAAYNGTAEISVYIKPDEEGQGFGARLYAELLQQAKRLGYHALLAGISLPNDASIRIHEKFGFEQVAHFKQTGYKLDRWVDVGYWQLLLE